MASAISAAASSGLAVVVGIAAVHHLVADRGDQRLRGAATVLAGELLEDREENEHESIAETVADENGELVTSGIRLAIFSAGKLQAGDDWVPAVAPGSCHTRATPKGQARACGLQWGELLLVAAERSDEAALLWIYLSAGLGALLVGATLAALTSFAVASWGLGPLQRVTTAIASLRPEEPLPAALDEPARTDEVESIRVALRTLLLRSQALLTQAQTFAANAAHELRTPLTAIRTEIELLLEEEPGGQDRAGLARVRDRITKLTELIERLLVLAAPVGAQGGGEAVALCDLVPEVLAELSEAERARVRWKPIGEGLVRGEPALLRSMAKNAIDNALKFSASEPVTVELVENGAVTLAVRDLGPGISDHDRARVFEPFYRGARSGVAGHGLGLSLIAHIARASGGEATFEPVTSGARLIIRLPRWAPASDAPHPQPSHAADRP